MKLTYRVDTNKDIIIYHDNLSGDIKKHLLSDFDKSNIVVDPFDIKVNVRVALLFIKNVFKIRRSIPYRRFMFMVYQYSYVEYLNPKIVITFVDNSIIFQWLSINYTDASFYAIQNGSRSRYELYYHYYHDFKHSLTNFFCFGDYEVEKYREYGHSVKNFIPVGSFRHAIYKDDFINRESIIKYDIALISQHKLTTFDGTNIRLKDNLELIDQYLSSYLKMNNELSFIILCRSKENSSQGRMEKKYFRSICGDKVNLRFQDTIPASTYTGIDQSNLIICCNSTALIEAAGYGKKVLFCDYSGDGIWADYPPGIWLHNEKDSMSFNKHIRTAIKSTKNDYIKFASYIMKRDFTIDKIKTEIYKNLLN